MYYRYFKVLPSELSKAMHAASEANKMASVEIMNLASHLGAYNYATDRSTGKVIGFYFDCRVDEKIWKRVKGYHTPKKNIRAGIEIQKQIDELPSIAWPDNRLREAGIYLDCPVLFAEEGGAMYRTRCTLIDGDFYIQVPWREVTKKELDEYAQQTNLFSLEMDHLSWQPPECLQEIKEWEFMKLVSELKNN